VINATGRSLLGIGFPLRAGFRDYRHLSAVLRESMRCAIELPSPSADELAHSAALLERIRAEIVARGPMDFARYMAMVLYEPGLGYYSAGRNKFGAAGDFVTAPELGDVFARCVARAVAPVLRETSGSLLELGAGSGAFAADALAALHALDALPAEYLILETSADLRERQVQRLGTLDPALRDRVRWLDAPPDAPWSGVLFANEVIDALPVRLFALRDDGLHERRVAVGPSAALEFVERPADAALRDAVRAAVTDLEHLPRPYRSEVAPQLGAWLEAVSASMIRGLALFVDYGYPRREYFLPQRVEGTLGCHYRHRFHDDPLWMPGLCDITAWVDFSALADAARASGLDVLGYASQAQFLIAAGLAEVVRSDRPRDSVEQLRLAQQIRMLTLPGEMGERFKVMALGRALAPALLPWADPHGAMRL
jgi:SAM-dependent MidA family methyltransferase